MQLCVGGSDGTALATASRQQQVRWDPGFAHTPYLKIETWGTQTISSRFAEAEPAVERPGVGVRAPGDS